MSVGDINSTERGSGARLNDGKPPLELIPARAMLEYYSAQRASTTADRDRALDCLERLARWQETGFAGHLAKALNALADPMVDAARVFDYGRKKYAAWNWAKGMAWSVPMACALRHLKAILEGQPNDLESFLPHEGHVACNIIMLQTFVRSYPEGDDRCPVDYLRERV